MPLPSSGTGSGSGLVGPTLSSGGASSNGYLSQTGVDLNLVGAVTDTLVLSTQTMAMVQITLESAPPLSSTSFVAALQGSIDGVACITTGKASLTVGVSATEDVTVYKLLRVIVTTANGSALLARVSILAKTI